MSTNRSFRVHPEKYGRQASQEGDLYLPAGPPRATVCLLHGGFWRMPFGRSQMNPVAIHLASHGFLIWKVGYRRIGEAGGGFPGTLDDALASVRHLSHLKSKYPQIDLAKLVLVGHSAGGHLAYWYGKDQHCESPGHLLPSWIVGLAPVLDLERAFEANLGNGAAHELMGCTPSEDPKGYRACSPIANVSTRVRQLLLHGSRDEEIPSQWSRDYAATARAAGAHVEHIEVPDGKHMDFLSVGSRAYSLLFSWLDENFSM